MLADREDCDTGASRPPVRPSTPKYPLEASAREQRTCTRSRQFAPSLPPPTMMTAHQQSTDQVKPFAYPHGTPAAAVDVAPSASAAESSSAMSGGNATTAAPSNSAASPPTTDRKRKQPPSPSDDAGANGSADTSDADKSKEQQQQPSKKSRRELPPHTVAILKGWMLSREHVKHPYPTDEVRSVKR